MSEVTPEQVLLVTACLWVVLTLPAGVAVLGLYRVWRRYFHRQPVSSVAQRINLLGWWLLVGLLIAYIVCCLWFFGWLWIWIGLTLPGWIAAFALYRVWRRYFHRQPIASCAQLLKLLGWLLLAGLVLAYIVYWLRFFFGPIPG